MLTKIFKLYFNLISNYLNKFNTIFIYIINLISKKMIIAESESNELSYPKSSLKKNLHLNKINEITSEMEKLITGLSPKAKRPVKKSALRIQIDYDDEDTNKFSKMLSFSPLNNHSKNIPVKCKLSFNTTVNNELSIFSKLLKKSCKTLALNSFQDNNEMISMKELSKIAEKEGDDCYLSIKSHKTTNEDLSNIIGKDSNKINEVFKKNEDSDVSSDNDNESKSFKSKTFSTKSNKRVGSEELQALYYVEEDQFYDELDENFKKYYVSAVDNFAGNYNVYITNSLMLISLLPDSSYFSQEVQKRKDNYEFCNFKRLMILDLDETLIHTDFEYKFESHDVYLKMKTEDGIENIIPINIRPYLKEFLEFSSKYFDIVAFTASCKEYADVVIDYIDPDKKYFKYRLYRESCVIYKNLYLKFLEVFSKNLKDVIIVENSMFSFSYSLKNGILVTSFYDDKDDQDLLSLIEFLETGIIYSNDVRDIIEATFEFTKIQNSLKDVSYEDMQSIVHYPD